MESIEDFESFPPRLAKKLKWSEKFPGCIVATIRGVEKLDGGLPKFEGKPAKRAVMSIKLGRRLVIEEHVILMCKNPNCLNPDHMRSSLEGISLDDLEDHWYD